MSYKPSSYWDRLEAKNEREALARQCQVMRDNEEKIAAVTKGFSDYCGGISNEAPAGRLPQGLLPGTPGQPVS